MNTKAKTALLLFSRSAKEESKCKELGIGITRKSNQALCSLLIKKTISTLEQTEFPVFKSFSTNQKGLSFGERLANALENVFHEGFENVIIVGNDCPSLSVETINKAHQLLLQNDVVLGPTIKNGVYLIGIKKTGYRRSDFLYLNWQKRGLHKSWIKYVQSFDQSLAWLKSSSDINTAQDLFSFLKGLPKVSLFKKLILQLIGLIQSPLQQENNSPISQRSSLQLSFRGPPLS